MDLVQHFGGERLNNFYISDLCQLDFTNEMHINLTKVLKGLQVFSVYYQFNDTRLVR